MMQNVSAKRTGLPANLLPVVCALGMLWPAGRAHAQIQTVTPLRTAPAKPQDFILGADISWIPEQEARERKFYDGEEAKDIFQILKEHQFNWVRLRLFNNPRATNGYSTAGFCDLEHTTQMALRAKAAGMHFLLDFHYSDTWADPGKQFKPHAWEGLEFEALTKAMHDYTREVITALKDKGVPPEMVQVGNEINHGLVWPDGRAQDWDKLAALLKAGIAGVRDADPSIRVMLHIACGGQNAESRSFLDNARRRGVEFDVIGESYYPRWHGTTNDLQGNLTDLVGRYPQPVIVAEYSEHKRAVNDIAHGLPDGKGLGTFIWEPTQWGEPLFDRSGHARAELDLYPQMARDYRSGPAAAAGSRP
jgi:arabinogalactan endo-1,4-beta-galactosidase